MSGGLHWQGNGKLSRVWDERGHNEYKNICEEQYGNILVNKLLK